VIVKDGKIVTFLKPDGPPPQTSIIGGRDAATSREVGGKAHLHSSLMATARC
jgi:hypothetical protein